MSTMFLNNIIYTVLLWTIVSSMSFISRKYQKKTNWVDSVTAPFSSEMVLNAVNCVTTCLSDGSCMAVNVEIVDSDGFMCHKLDALIPTQMLTEQIGSRYIAADISAITLCPDVYNYQSTGVTVTFDMWNVCFIVKACHNAHLGLSSGAAGAGNIYEIVIGGWNNTKSLLRYCKQSCQVDSTSIPSVLSCTEFRLFWASWKNGHVQFGNGWRVGENVLLQYQDSTPHAVQYVSVSTGWGATGEFAFVLQ